MKKTLITHLKFIVPLLQTVLYILIISFVFSGCSKCEEHYVEGTILQITVVDAASGKYVYSKLSPLLPKDSIRVKDINGANIPFEMTEMSTRQLPIEQYYSISIYFLSTDTNIVSKSFSEEQCKKVLIELVGIKRLEYDICFRSENQKCGTGFKSIKVTSGGVNIPVNNQFIIGVTEKINL